VCVSFYPEEEPKLEREFSEQVLIGEWQSWPIEVVLCNEASCSCPVLKPFFNLEI
jgi:hypothetical protein